MTQRIDLTWTGERFLPDIEGDIALEHFHRYAMARSLASDKRVLDVACGEGYGARILAEVAASVIGVDIDPATIAHAKATYKRPNLHFCQDSCTSLNLQDSSIDLAVSFETLEHHAEHDVMLAELSRVLTPDGLLIISTPDKRHYSDDSSFTNPFHVRELYSDEFIQLMSRHFQYTAFFGQRITYGSLVTPIGGSGEFTSFSMANDDILTQPGLAAPIYLIAIASAKPLPPVPASLFDYTKSHILELNLLRQDLQVARDLLASIQSSTFWRVAEPIRWLRRAIRRMWGHSRA